MIDVLLLVAIVTLPIAAFLTRRSVTWVAVALTFGFGVAGNALQSLIAVGMEWTTRGVQALAVLVMAVVALLAWRLGPAAGGGPSRSQQVRWIVVPALGIGAFLVVMRLLAPGSPGALSAVGYLVNHPQAEDNAKWLHLTAQLADQQPIEFAGYAGGPLLLLMSLMAALISVLSIVLLGGVNEVAVAANTLVATQFLLIALVPFAFAPFVERRLRPIARAGDRNPIAWPAIGIAMAVLAVGSSIITSFGHLSLQFVLLVLVLWSACFLLATPGRARLLMTLAIATTASVWLPFNVLGLAVLALTLAWLVRRRDAIGLVAWAAVVLASWDALLSSTLFLLGVGAPPLSSEGASPGAPAGDGGLSIQSQVLQQVETATSLFTAPGGVEQVQPVVALLALACVLAAAWLLCRGTSLRAGLRRFGPIVLMAAYLLAIQIGDAIATGAAPHYGGHKLGFAITMMALASTLPIAIMALDGAARGMTTLRWLAVGGLLLALTLDTMLPRAISALSPMLWPTVDASSPAYWAPAEVKPVADQPIASLPVACVFAEPGKDPAALPLGQQSYGCTRLLLGLGGLEGDATVLVTWLQTDWLSNEPHWDDFRQSIEAEAGELTGRTVVLMSPDGGTSGFTTLGELLSRFPVSSAS